MDAQIPIEGNVLILAGAKASVPADTLPALVARVQRYLSPDIETYRRQFECILEDDERAVFLVSEDHWPSVGESVGLSRRETDAVRRAHEEQLLFLGSRTDRRDEFETALEIRDPVVVGTES